MSPKNSSRNDHDGTRELVLNLVVEQGPITASRIGALLHLTPAAVRRHLSLMQDKGIITTLDGYVSQDSERGRPARRFVATEAGRVTSSGTTYSSIATQALSYIKEKAGKEALEEFVDARVAELEKRYHHVLEAAGSNPAARVEALARAITADGYASTVRRVANGVPMLQLCQGCCPIEEVARDFPQMCDLETKAFSRLLGVHVQRLSTLAGGGHVCTTVVPVSHLRVRSNSITNTETTNYKGRK